MRVLIVDDDVAALLSLNRLLGGKCLLASNLEEGLYLASQHRPDLVVLDVHFAGCAENGIDSAPSFQVVVPRTQVVIVSALHRAADALRAYDAGCCAYVDKTDPEQIRRLVRLVDQVKSGGQPCPSADPAFLPVPTPRPARRALSRVSLSSRGRRKLLH